MTVTTRRQFLRGAASGIVFCSCGLHAQAQSLASARTGGGDAGDNPALNYKHPDFGKKRASVVIDGRPIKTIDVHAHCFFHETVVMAGPGVSVNGAVKGGPQPVSRSRGIRRRRAGRGVDRHQVPAAEISHAVAD